MYRQKLQYPSLFVLVASLILYYPGGSWKFFSFPCAELLAEMMNTWWSFLETSDEKRCNQYSSILKNQYKSIPLDSLCLIAQWVMIWWEILIWMRQIEAWLQSDIKYICQNGCNKNSIWSVVHEKRPNASGNSSK